VADGAALSGEPGRGGAGDTPGTGDTAPGGRRRAFASDNWSGVHPDVLAAMAAANVDHAPSYGDDTVTAEAAGLFKQHFGDDAEVCFVFNGTGANVVGLQALLRPFEAVICAESAHINVDECGAPERFLGSKLVAVPAPEGKLTPTSVAAAAGGVGDQHHVQPRVVSITQATEVGTCYRVDEVRALADWAHEHGMSLHLDGARLSNAAAWLEVGLGAFGSSAGVDVLSFGGTKNGAMAAEAVVAFGSAGDSSLRYIRKQSMQLASKMRFVSAQFVAILSGDLWRVNARHANHMAGRLAEGVSGVPGVALAHPVEANGVFAVLPRQATEALQKEHPFHTWDEAAGVVRWMTSFDTTEEDVDDLVASVSRVMARVMARR
jgi:threonine aldolase